MSNFYDSLSDTGAKNYESWYEKEGKKVARREINALLSLLKDFRGMSILEIGCGTGYFSRLLKREGFQVVGVDKAWQMLRLTHLKGITGVRADAHFLPFRDKSFDIALFVTSFEFMKKSIKVLKEAKRVTRKTIIFLLLNPFHFVNIRRKFRSLFCFSPFRHMKMIMPSNIKKAARKICDGCRFEVYGRLIGGDVFYTAQIFMEEEL